MKSRKTHRANIEKTVPFFFRIGLIVSISLAIVAFEWKTPIHEKIICEFPGDWIEPETIFIPITYPPKKEIELPKEDSKLLDDKPELIDEPKPEKKEPEKIEPKDVDDGFMKGNEIPEKLEPEPFLMASEIEPMFPGGDEAFKEYLENNIEYPKAAKEIDLNGKVYLSFIVTKTGSIKDIEILKDIGGGCGKEAVRVVREMPKWIPGRQGGENVNVQMKMCLNFGLL